MSQAQPHPHRASLPLPAPAGATISEQNAAKQPASAPEAFTKFATWPDDAFVRIDVVARLFACSRATVWRRTADGSLPAPVKLSARSTAWRVGDLRRVLRALAEGGVQ